MDNEYTIGKMLAEDANAAENIVTAEMLIDTMKTKLADLIERTMSSTASMSAIRRATTLPCPMSR